MKSFTQLLTAFLLFNFLVSCQKIGLKQDELKSQQMTKQINDLVHNYHQKGQFSGAVLVADQGSIIFNKEYGYKDRDEKENIDSESMFEIASLSKQFTAMLIMMLEEEGKINYDDKIIKYFPELPYENITIRHLLTHTSGLSERQFFGWAGQNMQQGKIYHNEFVLNYLKNEKPQLAFNPGEKWEYSNVGYFLLALILQENTGKHYTEILREKILQPLEMKHTGIFSQQLKGNEMEDYVFGKVFNSKDSVFIPSFGLAWSDSMYGGVGILSNTIDLLKWDRALYDNTLISDQSKEAAFSSYQLSDGNNSEYGFGWYVRDNFEINGDNYGKRLDHNGLWPGYESSMVRYIDQDKTIIILSNQAPSVKDQLVEEISTMLFATN